MLIIRGIRSVTLKESRMFFVGMDYRLISYYPVTIGAVTSVMATDATNVTVTLAGHDDNPDSNPTVAHPRNQSLIFSAGDSFDVSLAKYESFQVRMTVNRL